MINISPGQPRKFEINLFHRCGDDRYVRMLFLWSNLVDNILNITKANPYINEDSIDDFNIA